MDCLTRAAKYVADTGAALQSRDMHTNQCAVPCNFHSREPVMATHIAFTRDITRDQRELDGVAIVELPVWRDNAHERLSSCLTRRIPDPLSARAR
jgi:hypothetical protein